MTPKHIQRYKLVFLDPKHVMWRSENVPEKKKMSSITRNVLQAILRSVVEKWKINSICVPFDCFYEGSC